MKILKFFVFFAVTSVSCLCFMSIFNSKVVCDNAQGLLLVENTLALSENAPSNGTITCAGESTYITTYIASGSVATVEHTGDSIEVPEFTGSLTTKKVPADKLVNNSVILCVAKFPGCGKAEGNNIIYQVIPQDGGSNVECKQCHMDAEAAVKGYRKKL